MSILDWMEQTSIAVWVSTSPAGYYIMLAFHALGLAIVVGSVSVIDLRILGRIRGIAVPATAGIVKFAWFGLVMNALSGVALFLSEANKAYYSISFRIKITLMVLGVISTVIMNKTVLIPAKVSGVGSLDAASGNAKAQACLSLALWASVIVVGRMMSYLTEFTVNP